jgi:hypothetical protein
MPSPQLPQYPPVLDTVQSLQQVINNFATTLSGPINDVQTTIPLSSVGSLNQPGVVSIGTEVIYYQTIAGLNLTSCIRGFDGTTAAAAVSGATVEQRWVAVHHNLLAACIAAIEATLGVNPQGAFATVAALLAANVPQTVLFPTAVTDWSFTHTRDRIVQVQLWRLVSGEVYEVFDAPMEQVVDPVTCQVNITLPNAEAGYAIFN